MDKGKRMTFREFLQMEGGSGSGNKNPTPQRKINPTVKFAAVMPARSVPDHDPVQPKLQRTRFGSDLFLIPKPKNTVGVISRPSL